MENFYKALEENRNRINEIRKDIIKKEQKQYRKELAFTITICGLIMIICCMLLCNINSTTINDCLQNGNSQNYCENIVYGD